MNILDLKTVRADYDDLALVILDQTMLPGEEVYKSLHTPEEIKEAIWKLRVRGAPAIGVAAAYGISICMQSSSAGSYESFMEEFSGISDLLESARPTAVNLSACLRRMKDRLQKRTRGNNGEVIGNPYDWKLILREEAQKIRDEDAAACRKIGENALTLLKPGMGLLTHCNAGHLAVSEYGTALAPIYLGQERGYNFHVYSDETRPLLQGARLTSYELHRSGVDVTLICDNMASTVMRQGRVTAVLVGCDRVAANGDTANKIGTSGVAVLAKYYGIPFYVLGPVSTLDFDCPDGNAIKIEERPAEEVTELWYEKRMAPEGVKVYNPAFDVTDASLITAIITEKGIARPPYRESLAKFCQK